MKRKVLLDQEVARHRCEHGQATLRMKVEVEPAPAQGEGAASASVGWSAAYADGWEATFGGGKGRAN